MGFNIMAKLTFDKAVDLIADGRTVDENDVQARALSRRVWVAEWRIPGCMSESFSICTTRADAIKCARQMCGNVRGAKSDLMRYGRTDRVSPDAYVSMATTTVKKLQLSDLL